MAKKRGFMHGFGTAVGTPVGVGITGTAIIWGGSEFIWPKLRDSAKRAVLDNLQNDEKLELPYHPIDKEFLMVPVAVDTSGKDVLIYEPLSDEAKSRNHFAKWKTEVVDGEERIVFAAMRADDTVPNPHTGEKGVEPYTQPGWDVQTFLSEAQKRKVIIDKNREHLEKRGFIPNLVRAGRDVVVGLNSQAKRQAPDTRKPGDFLMNYLPWIGGGAALLTAVLTNFTGVGLLIAGVVGATGFILPQVMKDQKQQTTAAGAATTPGGDGKGTETGGPANERKPETPAPNTVGMLNGRNEEIEAQARDAVDPIIFRPPVKVTTSAVPVGSTPTRDQNARIIG